MSTTTFLFALAFMWLLGFIAAFSLFWLKAIVRDFDHEEDQSENELHHFDDGTASRIEEPIPYEFSDNPDSFVINNHGRISRAKQRPVKLPLHQVKTREEIDYDRAQHAVRQHASS